MKYLSAPSLSKAVYSPTLQPVASVQHGTEQMVLPLKQRGYREVNLLTRALGTLSRGSVLYPELPYSRSS